MIIAGYVDAARIDRTSEESAGDLTVLRRTAASLEGEFLGDARRAVDEVIETVAERQSSWLRRSVFELLFAAFVFFLLGRVGYNFFWSSFLARVFGTTQQVEPLLTIDFYIPALLFWVMWSGILVGAFTLGLCRSLNHHVRGFAESMATSRLAHGLFPSLESTCQAIDTDSQIISRLLDDTQTFRRTLAGVPTLLGRRRQQLSGRAGTGSDRPQD